MHFGVKIMEVLCNCTVMAVIVCLTLTTQFGMTVARDVFSIGNPRLQSDGGPDLTGAEAAVFLLDEKFPATGVFFAFEGYYRNSNPIKLQIWRPTGDLAPLTGAGEYKLVGEIEQVPAVESGVEATYIVSKFTQKCIKVGTGDRLGIYVTNMTSSLSYTFTGTKLTSLLAHWNTPITSTSSSAQASPVVGDTVGFSEKVFPYHLSIAAFYYMDETLGSSLEDEVDCPADQLIDGDPKYSTTTTQLPQGPPGATGPQGPSGDTGPPGPVILVGNVGAPGLPGPTGQVGVPGTAGGTGDTGYTGSAGLDGATGARGATGRAGATGFEGVLGPIGPVGPPGMVIFVTGSESGGYTSGGSVLSTATIGTAPFAQEVLSDEMLMYGWASETRMIGALIWLSLLSLIIIISLSGLVALTHLHRSEGMGGTLRRRHRHSDSPDLGLDVVYPGDVSTLSGGDQDTQRTRSTSGTGTLGNYGTSNPSFQTSENFARRGDGAEDDKGGYGNFEGEERPNWEAEMREDSFQQYSNQTATKFGTVRQ